MHTHHHSITGETIPSTAKQPPPNLDQPSQPDNNTDQKKEDPTKDGGGKEDPTNHAWRKQNTSRNFKIQKITTKHHNVLLDSTRTELRPFLQCITLYYTIMQCD